MATRAPIGEAGSDLSVDDRRAADLTGSTLSLWFLSGPLLPNATPRHFAIHCESLLVGRSTDLPLSLPSKSVSSIHAELIPSEDFLTVRDLGSTNGTYVNASRISQPHALKPGDLLQFADVPFRVLKQNAVSQSKTVSESFVDQALALVHFERLMDEEAVEPHYQPIVNIRNGQIVGYEVLARSQVHGLETPLAMFSAAAKLSMERQLSQMLRAKGIEQSLQSGELPHLFVNTHPIELTERGLFESIEVIRHISPRQPITLEIHESAVSNPADLSALRDALRALDIGLAFDDFGAGQARIVELCEVRPDYLKFDMSLIRHLHEAPKEHFRMVSSLAHMAREIDVIPLAEGIECEAEAKACIECGFELAQGYHFGKPARLFRRA